MFGLHILDFLVMTLYFVAMIVIGLRVSKGIKNYEDFVMGGRQMGRWLQTFMNFGTGTSAETAVDAARETYDTQEMALTRVNPNRFEYRKLFPKSNCEFEKPSRRDVVGFLLPWLAVGGVLATMYALAKIGS